jgi:hypothetical protein
MFITRYFFGVVDRPTKLNSFLRVWWNFPSNVEISPSFRVRGASASASSLSTICKASPSFPDREGTKTNQSAQSSYHDFPSPVPHGYGTERHPSLPRVSAEQSIHYLLCLQSALCALARSSPTRLPLPLPAHCPDCRLLHFDCIDN